MNKVSLENFNIWIDDFGVTVKGNYLSIPQIQQIADTMMKKAKNYAEEIVIRDTLILEFMTDISKETIKNDYDYIVQSGLMNIIHSYILNLNLIEEYIKDKRSINKAVIDFLNTISKNVDKYGKKLPSPTELKTLMEEMKTIKI